MAKIIQDSSDIIRELQPNNVDLKLKLSKNVNDKFDYIENVLPHEDATGTNITMDNTTEYYIRTHNIKGDSSQVTTTGKNLFILPNSITQNGITYQKNADGTFNISGTATANTNLYISVDLSDTNISDGTYTISKKSSGYNSQIDMYNDNTWVATPIYVYGNNLNSTATITIPSNITKIRFIIYVANGNSINLTNEHIQLEKSSSATDFEPYTGGKPGPNPDYPQEVEVVKGKNLLNINRELGTPSNTALANTTPRTFDLTKLVKELSYNNYYNTGTVNSYSINGDSLTVNNKNIYGIGFPMLLQKGSYTLSYSSLSISDVYIALYKTDGTSLTGYYRQNIVAGKVSYTFTIDSELVVVPIFASHTPDTDITFTNIQLEEGSTATEYVPYRSIGVNVLGKNLFDKDNVKVGYTWNNTTNTARSAYFYETEPNKTYTISANNWNDLFYDIVYLDHIGATTNLYESGWYNPETNPSKTFTTSSGTNILGIHFKYTSAGNVPMTQTMFDNATIQLEKGSTATEYVPYHSDVYPLYLGDTELCKIDGYQDCFKKSTGKNLANINDASIGHTWSNATNTQRATILWIPLIEGERYTFASSYTNTHITQIRGVLNKGPQDTASSQIVSGSFDAPSGWGYISIEIIADTTFTIDMLEGTKILFCKGNATISDYEPYDIGVWYLHKEIGKVVLDGSETWIDSGYNASAHHYTYQGASKKGGQTNLISNKFVTSIVGTAVYSCVGNASNTNITLKMPLDISDTTQMKTWLSSNNTTMYYELATPTNTVVTDETLLQQLQDLDNAISYEGTTYLTTLGNLPPIVDITYTQDIKKLIAAATQS